MSCQVCGGEWGWYRMVASPRWVCEECSGENDVERLIDQRDHFEGECVKLRAALVKVRSLLMHPNLKIGPRLFDSAVLTCGVDPETLGGGE